MKPSRQSCGRRAQIGAALFLLLCLMPSNSQCAADSAPTEYEVKAAYLYNFGRFVKWPKATGRADSFDICVLGQDPFGRSLGSTLAGQTIEGARVLARRISKPLEAADCRIVFISSSTQDQLASILADVEKMSVLTVGDMPEFTRRGGMIQFVLEGNKVRFEVNLVTAERAGLNLSSQLLRIATHVKRGP